MLFQVYDDWFDRDTDVGWINAYKYLSREEASAFCREMFERVADEARAAGVLDVVVQLVRCLQRYDYFSGLSV